MQPRPSISTTPALRRTLRWTRKKTAFTAGLAAFLVWYYFALPSQLFNDPHCTVIQSRDGFLLSASIARDGQWRFPATDSLPSKFETCLLRFEDRRFRYHPGVDIFSLAEAVRQNLSAGSIVRGGSTISMQVIRLSRKGQDRTLHEKLYEMILATRLELRYSKDEILRLYASHAPFGGNVVGIDAACWRYFGRSASELSWAEAAFLAVLPNAPSLVHPGRNRSLLLNKRNRLLDALSEEGHIDELTLTLAKTEPLPEKPHALPSFARHLLTRTANAGKGGQIIQTSIRLPLQQRVEEVLTMHHQRLAGNEIHNGAVVIADVASGEVLAYAGNIPNLSGEGADVDLIVSPRSTGSILKPLLFAAALDEGKILPKTLLPDIPAFINGFTPKNFSHEYDGAVPADQALIRSLNIPSVFLLKDYRYEKFHTLLRHTGFSTLGKPADHYGLSLILGGAEATLWDVAGVYASMARTLNNFFTHPGSNKYDRSDFHPLSFEVVEPRVQPSSEQSSWLSASSIYQTYEVLRELYRPGEESGWKHFSSSRRIAWKTGTSFGFRDAWAVGVTPDYVVAVWVGNADGEGRPGLTGIEAAAPLMFDVFSTLSGDAWFRMPQSEMVRATVCRTSGLRATANCTLADTLWIGQRGVGVGACNYHQLLHVSRDGRYQLNSRCADLSQIQQVSWFVLPPVQEFYYRKRNLSYQAPPPYRSDCWPATQLKSMDLVYPKPGARLFIPRDRSGESGSAVFQLAHRNPTATVYWYMDGHYLGATRKTHHLALSPSSGKHLLTLVDEGGDAIEADFEILSGL